MTVYVYRPLFVQTDRNKLVPQSLGSYLFITAIAICMTSFENRIPRMIFGLKRGSNRREEKEAFPGT